MTDPLSVARRSAVYALWLVAVISMGLASRSQAINLPAFWAKYLGDALWAMMFFVGLAWLLPRQATMKVAVLAFAVCCTVEFSQLYHAEWIDTIRKTLLGRLVLGSSFARADFVAYLAGIFVAAAIQWTAWCLRRGSGKKVDSAPI